jgi:Trk K+ transport system NAD-binding subunit
MQAQLHESSADSALFLMLRRMRAPLLVLIGTYAVSMLGMVLIPGVDGNGMPWRVSFFHAFYFLSYTATTIGFGEIPYAFTDAQRMWVTFSIYITVIGWFYAIGKILQLMQDPAFRQVVAVGRFTRRVSRLRAPFYLVCGYGETGSALVSALDHRQMGSVVVDIDPQRVAEVELADLALDIPALVADVRVPGVLLAAGLRHPQCLGVIALTSNDAANLAVALTVKLLRPGLRVLCRCESADVARNMASFGTDHIVNPFELFGQHLARALTVPGMFLLRDWLTLLPEERLSEPSFPPHGHWVVAGYGRFGREMVSALEANGNRVTVIEQYPEGRGRAHVVQGRGTEAVTLEQAHVREAVGIVAGTDDDVDNLSIVMTARELNPDLFVVLRRNQRHSRVLTDAIGAQLTMQPSAVVVHACLAILTSPLLARFLEASRAQDNEWCNEVLARIAGVIGERAPESWALEIDDRAAPAVAVLSQELPVTVDALCTDPQDRAERLPVIPLALVRDGEMRLLPVGAERVRVGDQLLFCGRGRARRKQSFVVANVNVLRYVVAGEDVPGGWIWRRFVQRNRRGPIGPAT